MESSILEPSSARTITLDDQARFWEERVIKKDQIRKHKVLKKSLMPAGLIDHLNDQQISDLYEYFRSIGK